MKLSFEQIKNDIQQMTRGQTEFYTDENYDLNELSRFLCENEYEFGIEVKPHTESKTGEDNIDIILVKKL